MRSLFTLSKTPVGAEGEGGNIRHLFIVVLRQSRLVQNLATVKHKINGMRIRDVYPGTEFFHPGSRVKTIPYPGYRSASKTYFLNLKSVSKLSEKLSGMFISDPASEFFAIPDPGYGSATLFF